ncbi:MAG TPA: adenylate/guanylate cyclase domain-containing protein [Dongiaceae bacterium]|nr:adenylate/guanylate cyclase domain-containing protein [Dongiaceae bacterium]
MKVGVALKIGGIILILLVLVGAVAWINTRGAQRVQALIEDVDKVYVPAYGALARANLRLTEEGIFVRRLLLSQLTQIDMAASEQQMKQAIAEKSQQTVTELDEARRLIQVAINRHAVIEDETELARLDTMLSFLRQRHMEYEAVIALLEGSVARGDLGQIQDQIKQLDIERGNLNDEAEAARVKMRSLLDNASNLAIRAQDVSVKVGLLLLGLALALGSLTGAVIIAGLLRPLKRLLQGTLQVQAGNLDTEVKVTTRDEVGELTVGFNNMVRELRAKARIRETFGRYVDPRIIEDLIDNPDRLGAIGERREMTILFSDMRGFTDLSEGMTPDGMVKVINRYLALMSEPVLAHRGIIDKYLGDGVMAFWGPPFCAAEDHARLACEASAGQLAALQAFRAELPELTGMRRGIPEVDIRIGVATGEVVVGNIGSSLFMNYTVMGDAVNLASRLESANKVYGTRLLVCDRTAALAGETIVFREIDRLRVEGRKDAVQIFDALGRAGEVPDDLREMASHFAAGLAAYRNRDWATAEHAFSDALTVLPDDGPSRVLLQRTQRLQVEPPPVDWDGIWTLHEK